MPQTLLPVREAMRLALDKEQAFDVETSWSSAGTIPGDPDWAGGTVSRHPLERGARHAGRHFDAVCRLGGQSGWHRGTWLWGVRGWIDRLVGGPGLRRGRRHPEQLAYGDALDFWRVTEIDPSRHLQLRAEMRLPGEALLDFRIEPVDAGQGADVGGTTGTRSLGASAAATECRLVQEARFLPRGLLGLIYWYLVLPFHSVVFNGLLKGIVQRAQTSTRTPAVESPLAV